MAVMIYSTHGIADPKMAVMINFTPGTVDTQMIIYFTPGIVNPNITVMIKFTTGIVDP